MRERSDWNTISTFIANSTTTSAGTTRTAPEDDKPSEYDQNNKLPEWKRKRPVFSELHSKAAQATVARFHHNLAVLSELKQNGYNVGRFKRQAPSEYRSVTYNQSGFDLDEKRGVHEHSCPSCGFETDRDANAAMNVLQRGFLELGLGWPEETPVETVTVPRNAMRFWCANESFALVNATDTAQFESVSASHVIETGSLPS